MIKALLLVLLAVISANTHAYDYYNNVKAFKIKLTQAYRLDESRAWNFSQWIIDASLETGVPKYLIASLIRTESNFRYEAQSHRGAVGPAQIKPNYWNKFCLDGQSEAGIFNPHQNVACSAKILKLYKSQCGNWKCAAEWYNVGPAGAKEVANRKAKRRYVLKVREHAKPLTVAMLL